MTETGALDSRRIDFFPQGVWNNGMEAVTMSERSAGWIIEPGDSSVSHFENMIEINGRYESPENPEDAFDYHIFLRPWGMLWEDVRSGDTSGCIARDMMPLYYDNWYLSLLSLGFEHPTASFGEGIDAINKSLEASAGALDPAAKEGADGYVDMATLKELLPWCKKEVSYDTTYDEIAQKFGVHGKSKESLFEDMSYYVWWTTEDDYIQIGFNIHPDGSETWNVTSWSGIE